MKRLLMEFLGTFFLVLTIVMTSNPFAIAAMLMAWVYIGGHVSGGHYNPLVSLAVALRGRLELKSVPWYMLAQVLGGLVAFAFNGFLGGRLSVPAPGLGITIGQAFVVEVLLSLILALVVLTVSTSDKFKGNQVFGFAIGFTVPALAILGSPISGGLFNPALAIGSAVFAAYKGTPILYNHLGMYVGGALLGGAIAAYLFKYFGEK